MQHNFTKGPWEASFNGYYWDIRCAEEEGKKSLSRYDPHIASTINNDSYEHTEGRQESNARLVSASPDLYEALEQAVTSMQDHGYSNRHIAVRAARQALAKARGESNV